MAYPKTPEELKIYKELLEKYKDNPETLDLIKWNRDDKTNHRSWAEIKEAMDYLNDWGNVPTVDAELPKEAWSHKALVDEIEKEMGK